MSDVIDFQAAWSKRHETQPDPEHVAEDEDGVRWYRFTCSYKRPDGHESVFDIWARSHEDAMAQLDTLRASARVDGQVYESGWIPL